MSFYCLKNTFLFGETILAKAMKLVEGATESLQRQKTLKVLPKF